MTRNITAADICAIVDFEAFQHNDCKYIREIGWINFNSSEPINIHVNIPKNEFLQRLSDPRIRRTFEYVRNKVHGLSYFPAFGMKTIMSSQIEMMINMLYTSAKTSKRYIVGYKGGLLEKEVLESLNIPCVNLEICFPSLPAAHKYIPLGGSMASLPAIKKNFCGFHGYIQGGNGEYHHINYTQFHCASTDVKFYRDWIVSYGGEERR
jgi:hypothetical protein